MEVSDLAAGALMLQDLTSSFCSFCLKEGCGSAILVCNYANWRTKQRLNALCWDSSLITLTSAHVSARAGFSWIVVRNKGSGEVLEENLSNAVSGPREGVCVCVWGWDGGVWLHFACHLHRSLCLEPIIEKGPTSSSGDHGQNIFKMGSGENFHWTSEVQSQKTCSLTESGGLCQTSCHCRQMVCGNPGYIITSLVCSTAVLGASNQFRVVLGSATNRNWIFCGTFHPWWTTEAGSSLVVAVG